jgi:hypothetical protein
MKRRYETALARRLHRRSIAPSCLGSPARQDDLPMIRFLFRLLGLWILAGAFIALIYDGTKSIASNSLYITKLGDTWNALHSTSLQLLQPAIERHLALWLWDPVVLNILTAPTWLVLGILGSILILLGRKKKPPIGYGRD